MDQADYELNQLRAYRGAIAEDKAYLEKARAELEEKFRAEDGDADAAETGTAGDPESGTIEEDDEVHAPASDAAPVPPQPKRDAADNSEDEEIDFEDSDEASNSGSLSTGGPKIPSARQVDALAAAKQRQADEKARRAARSALAKVQKEKQKAAKARYDERKKIEDQVKALQRRAAVVERQYHGWSAVVHGRPLGRDRWFNRYYWFDSWFGGGVADFVQTDNRAKKGEATEGGPLQRWASGKIWIELVGPEGM